MVPQQRTYASFLHEDHPRYDTETDALDSPPTPVLAQDAPMP
jgi:hypothetical protein